MESQLSYLSMARNVKFLRIIGLYPISPESSKIKKRLHRIYMTFAFLFILMYIFQQIIKVYKDRDDKDKVMDTIFLLLTYTDYIFKIAILWQKSDQIEEIMNITKGPIFNQGNIEHRAPLIKSMRRAVLTARVFSFMPLCNCIIWCIQPIAQHLQGIPTELPIWLPFDVNANSHIYFAVFYIWLQTTWLSLGNTTIDVFIAFLLEQCKTQVTILRMDIENVVKNSKQYAEEVDVSFSGALEIKLKNIVIHHSVIIKTSAKIQDIFSSVIFYQFVVGGWILCTSAYRMVKIHPASLEFLAMINYINCILIELFLYCYYGNEITYESEMLMESAYAANWLDFPVKHRRTLVLIMEKFKYPIRPMAGFIVPLSNSTFVSILRSSYSFYAFLKNSAKG